MESYLLFYPYDNSQMYPFENEGPGDTLWELGLTFTVSPGKTGFRGAEEHARLKGKERFKIFGVLADTDKILDASDELWAGGKKVGVVTCGMYSRLTKRSMAIARMAVDVAKQGTKLEACAARTCSARPLPTPSPSMIRKKRNAPRGREQLTPPRGRASTLRRCRGGVAPRPMKPRRHKKCH